MISPIPWTVAKTVVYGGTRYGIDDANGQEVSGYMLEVNAQRAVNCVNQHDALVELIKDSINYCRQFQYTQSIAEGMEKRLKEIAGDDNADNV